ncbi:hydantoinase/carbamoylase family amidase [Burkholderia sp. WSM2232]|uniref:hydantoinase/carbamoylase family amidase n=1 Tax=Burkholderia sp. WSM2232 TaxID=944436 RepID=UPI00040B03E6|nr:hydantoinase/carbamoylase family amidase [Burkholderia sp. WSM2232]
MTTAMNIKDQLKRCTPDMGLAGRLFDELYAQGFDGVGITRDAYGPGENAAHALMSTEAKKLGLEVMSDFAGNLHMTLPGRDRTAPRILLGSHLDTVAQGGNYDGAAGVIAGLAVVAGLINGAITPAVDVTVIAVRAEESGSWFPAGYPGSRAALASLPLDLLEARRKDTGRTLADHMLESGCDVDAIRRGERIFSPENVKAYIELHIEQGPVLDTEGIPVGIVTGIPSSRRLRAGRVLGEYNHSGATPRKYRADAAIALAELAVRMDQHWEVLDNAGRKLVCTFCVLETTEDASFTKIPGQARFQLDVRSIDPDNVQAMFDHLHAIVPDIEARRCVRFELAGEGVSDGVPMSPELRRALLAAAQAADVRCIEMPSGGGHDPVAFAQAGIPAALVFVANQNGSHNPHEAMRLEDFGQGCRVLMAWILRETDVI